MSFRRSTGGSLGPGGTGVEYQGGGGGRPGNPVLPDPLPTASEIVERATEIRVLAAEAQAAIDRLQAIRDRIDDLGGHACICADYILDPSPNANSPSLKDSAWSVSVTYSPRIA